MRYRDEAIVEEAKTYAAGSTAKCNFEISTPNMQSPEFPNTTIDQTLTAAARLLGGRSTRLK